MDSFFRTKLELCEENSTLYICWEWYVGDLVLSEQ